MFLGTAQILKEDERELNFGRNSKTRLKLQDLGGGRLQWRKPREMEITRQKSGGH
jgi:hypothetical protein